MPYPVRTLPKARPGLTDPRSTGSPSPVRRPDIGALRGTKPTRYIG